ncbi:MAG: saccharopine dehydrogenase NADP-binding domain-containing protein [Oscillospiraceae bacterium]|jgi:saccharopine dehydrogenase-like NADP-dependent oxidoreductase|nr:saccharopine dehydrogenase NADP-binding domain-containing protein [Oscillospiraceae bacterium]
MRLLIIGIGGVGQAAAMLIKEGEKHGGQWIDTMVLADYDYERAKKVAALADDHRFVAAQVDASDKAAILALVEKHNINFILNTVAPVFNEPIFDAAYEAGVGYMDCAMTLSQRHPEKPYEQTYVKLGDYQFARQEDWKKKNILAIVGSGVEPGVSDVFARFAEKHLFDEIDEIGVRDGDNYQIPGQEVAFGFSIWTTIEECLNPPIVWEKDRGWFTTECFSEPENFFFPGGIGNVEVVNIEHEEVILIPQYVKCKRCTFKYGVSREFRIMLKNLEALGLDRIDKKIKVGDSEISPRDFIGLVAPSPLDLATEMVGKGCAGTWVTGKKDGLFRSVYLYQLADNQECVKKYGTSSVVTQTAIGPVIMLDLIAHGVWKGVGVLGPEFFNPDPFVLKMKEYGFPAALYEKDSEYDEQYQRDEIFNEMFSS